MNKDAIAYNQEVLQNVSNELNCRLEENGYLKLSLDELKIMLGIKPYPGDEQVGILF